MGLNKLKALLEYLRISSRNKAPIEDAYKAGYANVVHRAVGDVDNPGLYYRLNANIGAHADLAGGKQATDIRSTLEANGAPNPGVLTLLARARKPIFMSDVEVNDPLIMADVLKDKRLLREVNAAQYRFPENIIEIPAGLDDNPVVPLFRVLNRRAAERALKRKGYDVVLYPNEIEGAHYGDLLDKGSKNLSIDKSVYKSLKDREEFARMLWENASPDPDAAVNKWFNPSMTTIDYSNYRDPWGRLIKARDYKTPGYCGGGLVALNR